MCQWYLGSIISVLARDVNLMAPETLVGFIHYFTMVTVRGNALLDLIAGIAVGPAAYFSNL
jgi:hypothetical protein